MFKAVVRYRFGNRTLAAICLGYLALIVYGSLVPFEFKFRPLEEVLNQLFDLSYREVGVAARADWIANFVLYVPLGYLLSACADPSVKPGRRGFGRAAVSVLLGFVVAIAVEFMQLFFPPRTTSLNDLVAEGLGLALGAALWRLAGARLTALWRSVAAGDPSAAAAGLALYALSYVVVSLFPYDFLVSHSEVTWKLEQDRFDWLLVSKACGEPLRCTAKLIIEILAAIPIGLLLGASYGKGTRLDCRIAMLSGLVLGLALEGLQFFLASGVSQGASVVTRAAGVVVGLWMVRSVELTLVRQLKRYGKLLATTLWIPYLALLAVLNGWLWAQWQTSVEALLKLSSVRFIPFYYHYYVPESVAVKSLLLQSAMYFPAGFACWIWAWGNRQQAHPGAWVAASVAAALALVIESSKLFQETQRPDPTNVLIAALSAAFAFIVARWIVRWSIETEASETQNSAGSA